MSIKPALRDLLSVSYDMLPTGQGGGNSHQRGKTPKWYVKYMTRCFFPHISRFPLRWQRNWICKRAKRPENPVTCFPPGRSPAKRERVYGGRASIGCSIVVLAANRRPPPSEAVHSEHILHYANWIFRSLCIHLPYAFCRQSAASSSVSISSPSSFRKILYTPTVRSGRRKRAMKA